MKYNMQNNIFYTICAYRAFGTGVYKQYRSHRNPVVGHVFIYCEHDIHWFNFNIRCITPIDVSNVHDKGNDLPSNICSKLFLEIETIVINNMSSLKESGTLRYLLMNAKFVFEVKLNLDWIL